LLEYKAVPHLDEILKLAVAVDQDIETILLDVSSDCLLMMKVAALHLNIVHLYERYNYLILWQNKFELK
jgi:hypothetical protein